MASCFPLLLQMPVFIIMYRVLHGLTAHKVGAEGYPGFTPQYVSHSTKLYQSLVGQHEMIAWGLDLSKRPSQMIAESFVKGLPYALLVVSLGVLYFVQQKMVAARAQVAPNMSETQAKMMQYLPVVFAFFLVFYLTGLVIYYMAQAIFRIGLQYYITHRFYKGEHSLGRQAQAAGERAREIAKKDGGGGGLFANAKRQIADAKQPVKQGAGGKPGTNGKPPTVSKRVTPPKNRPTSSTRNIRPASTGKAARPNDSRPKKK
jgi:YidC/Oxa1 family membrane protein insertase